MKIDKEKLKDKIEDILCEGIWTGQEVDVTAENILKLINPFIIAVENYEINNINL